MRWAVSPFHCFFFNDTLYRQIFGAPMGSCISPVVANIFMEHIKRQALSTFWEPPKISLRYVDDVFCVNKLSVIDDFHHHVNTLSPNIKFTLELENNSFLAFLDVRVNRTVNCKLWTTVYHKPTHTGRYLQFDYHHPYSISWFELEPCITESTPSFKNHLNANLILISPRKHWLSMVSVLDLPIPFLWVEPTSQLVLS